MSQKTPKRKSPQSPARAARAAGPAEPAADVEAGPGPAADEPPAGPEETAESEPAGPPPLRLTAAAAVAGLEGLAVVAWGVIMLFAGSGRGALAGVLVLVLAALPLAAAYGLRRARKWSRGPALIMQLICLPIAWTMLHSDGAVVPGGAALGVLALTGLVLLVHPATTDALGIQRS